MPRIVVVVLGSLALVACSGGGSATGGKPGAGTEVRTDGMVPRASTPEDPPRAPDDPAKGCTAACKQEADSLCLVGTGGECVECTTDVHCTSNPGAYGPRCDTAQSYCVCASDAECAENNRGKTCDVELGMCTCTGAADCKAPFSVCSDDAARTCQRPCASKADCPTDTTCQASTGKCVECLADSDCKTPSKGCDPTAHVCLECKTDADCAAAGDGWPACSKGSCVECTTAAHCAGNQYGKLCQDSSCGCKADADCAKGKCTDAAAGFGYCS